jgi:hypothetical protein
MNDELLRIFPEIGAIADEELRAKTLAVWAEAMQEGGWTMDELAAMPFTIHAENVQISFLEHVRTVCRMCVAVYDVLEDAYGPRNQKISRDTLIAGAMLADVGKLLEYKKNGAGYVKSEQGHSLRHPFSGVGLCFKHGIPHEVMHVVATHSKEGDIMTRSPESIIFHHADFIDFDLISKKRPF